MFNAEMLLGKMLSGALGSGMGSSRHGLGSSLASQLTSGAGLMTVIGLGVGAYEILKGQNTAATGAPPIPPVPSPAGQSMTPPPLPPLPGQTPSARQAPSAPVPAWTPLEPVPSRQPSSLETDSKPPAGLDGEALAFRMIQVMIAAAHADGHFDADEEGKILGKLQEQGLSREEQQVLLRELHMPRPIEQLVAGINDPATAQMMYSIAGMAIAIDTEAERQWLDRLAHALQISPNMQKFLENMSSS
jgi:uncharacterized membrane protein YebE (DUF533 family)